MNNVRVQSGWRFADISNEGTARVANRPRAIQRFASIEFTSTASEATNKS